jgi:alpha-tubulin suppressor-like RCC1 family protein
VALLSAAVLFTAGAAQATPTTRVVAWSSCGGACSVPSTLSSVTAVAAGSDFSLALKDNGTVVAWGCGFNYGECSVPGGLSGVTAIAAGHFHSLALKNDGSVAAWGCGGGFDYGQCSAPGGLSGVTAISANVFTSLALRNDGTVVAWGCGGGHDNGQCSVPGGLSAVTAIAAGQFQSLALKGDGTVVAWGCGGGVDYGQCSVPGGLSGVTAIAAGHTQSLALKNDGTVVAWGCGGFDYGQCSVPGGLLGVIAISAGYGHSLALKSDGTIVAWGCGGGFDLGQCNVPSGLFGVTAISAGDLHSLAISEWIDQTIAFAPLPDKRWGDPGFIVSATASSGLPVSFSSAGNCFLSNGTIVFITGAGSCTVTAAQSGGLNYNPAPDVSRTFSIEKASQSIIFAPLADKTFGDPDFFVSGSAYSGLPVSFTAAGRCTVTGVNVHLTGAGVCTITAWQPGDSNWSAAPPLSRSFSIASQAPPPPPPAPARCKVPNVVGKSLAKAKALIKKRRCRVGKVTHAYSRVRKRGVVIAQSRRPGRIVPAGSKIRLVVSRGAKAT